MNGKSLKDKQPRMTKAILKDQHLRLKRLVMSCASYFVTFLVVMLCSSLDMFDWHVTFTYLAAVIAINILFYFLFVTHANLRFRDPSLTSAQMFLSIVPALYVMYFLDAGQARAIFVVIAIVPMLYGVLALNLRQFLVTGSLFVGAYALLIAALALWRSEVLNIPLEILQGIVLVLVIAEITFIRGYISGLRSKLRERNKELKDALIVIQDMANQDELTGLSNRRHLFDILKQETDRENRAQGPLSICLLDVDHFKKVNDQYGHQVGDLVLKRISEAISHSLRAIDSFGRYGGEEFLLVLPQTDVQGALVKAERIREIVQRVDFSDIEHNFIATVSIGIAQYCEKESIDETIYRADTALYSAKRQGRNCCVSEEKPLKIKELKS